MAVTFPIIKNLGQLKAQLEAAFAALFTTANTWTATQAFPAAGITIGGLNVLSGAGTPEGAVAAPKGSLFLRTDGGATTSLYVKTAGTGNSGWTAK